MDKGKRRTSPILVDTSDSDSEFSDIIPIDVDSDSDDYTALLASVTLKAHDDNPNLGKRKRRASPIYVDSSDSSDADEHLDPPIRVDIRSDTGEGSTTPHPSSSHNRNPTGRNQYGHVREFLKTIQKKVLFDPDSSSFG